MKKKVTLYSVILELKFSLSEHSEDLENVKFRDDDGWFIKRRGFMLTEKVNFTLVSPEKLVLTDQVDMVVVPGVAGDFGVLPRHSALISTLRPGLVTIYRQDEKQYVFISSGFANVTESSCLVLGEDCEFVAEMNLQELEAYAQRLQEEIEIARTQKEIDELKKIHSLTLLKLDLIRKLVH